MGKRRDPRALVMFARMMLKASFRKVWSPDHLDLYILYCHVTWAPSPVWTVASSAAASGLSGGQGHVYSQGLGQAEGEVLFLFAKKNSHFVNWHGCDCE